MRMWLDGRAEVTVKPTHHTTTPDMGNKPPCNPFNPPAQNKAQVPCGKL